LPHSHHAAEVIDQRLQYLQMAGKEVFKYAVTAMIARRGMLEKAGVNPIKSAGSSRTRQFRIVDAVAARMNVGMEHFVMNLDRYGTRPRPACPSRCMRLPWRESLIAATWSHGLVRRRPDLGQHGAGVVNFLDQSS